MSPDSLPQLSLGTAALIIFAVCAGFILLRGMMRMIIGTVVLSLSAWVGFLVWQQAAALSVGWTGKSIPWIINGLPVLAFIVSFFLIRKTAKTLSRPFGKSAGEEKPRSIISIAFRLLLALISTSLLWLVGATLVHHSGAIAEVRAYSENSNGIAENTPNSFGQRLKSSIEATVPESWLRALDPLTTPNRLNLAKLIAAQSGSPREPIIDPRTGKSIPRAIIVDDPELQTLAREGKFGTLLRHPLLTKALADPKLQKILRDLNL